MFIVGNALLEDDLLDARFACELEACRGACCCLEGGRGAPLADDEVIEIERAYPVVRDWLPPEHRAAIERAGLVDGGPGSFATTCIEERACVFVYYEGTVARCSFERAYLDGRISWRKPLSCHLFPIRVRRIHHDALHYEQLPECLSGRVRGKREGIRLTSFLQEPLTRAYGGQWYAELRSCTDAA
jgi:hypothetical protein